MKKIFLATIVIATIHHFPAGHASMHSDEEDKQRKTHQVKRKLNDQVSSNDPKKQTIEATSPSLTVQGEQRSKDQLFPFLSNNSVAFSCNNNTVPPIMSFSSVKEEIDKDNISRYSLSGSSSSTNINNSGLKSLLKEAKNHLLSHQLKQTIKNFDQTLEIPELPNITRAEAFNNRGMIKYNFSQDAAAILDLNEALNIVEIAKSTKIKALTYRGRAKYKLGYHQEAILDLNEALGMPEITNTIKVEGLKCRGRAKYKLDLYAEALEDSNQVLKIPGISDMTRAYAINDRALAEYNLGQYTEVIEDCHQVLEIPGISDMTKASVLTCKALARYSLGQYPEAIKDLEDSLNFKNVFYNHQLSNIYQRLSLLHKRI